MMKNMRSRLFSVMSVLVLTLAALALMLSIFGAEVTLAESSHPSMSKVATYAKDKAFADSKHQAGPAVYIVVLQDKPLVAYRGGVQGLVATNPQMRGERKLNMTSANTVAYLNYLAEKRTEALAAIRNVLKRDVVAAYEYKATLHGFAIELMAAEAAMVANMPEVSFLERELQFELHTDAGPAWIGAPGIWDGSATGGLPGTMGEGIIVGVIDTGIDPWNPSFADIGGDLYDHTNPWGAGNYVGVCDSGDPSYDPTFVCNDKLIGAWGYTGVNGGDPRDSNGHGSHTASTAAGNVVNDTIITTTTEVFTATISGVAPHANVVMYAACCSGAALAAARDQAVIDGVDVVNYSIGASVPTANPWADAESQQWLNMRDAGIFVATSAGNNGPSDATLFRPGDIPWLTAVAASTHNRTFLNSLTVMDGVTGSITLDGESMTGPLNTPAEVVLSSWFTAGGTIDPEDARLCGSSIGNPFPSGTFSGEIVVCERGIYGRVAKGQNVADAGAGGYILAQPTEFGGGPGALASDPHVLPAVHIDYYEYQDLLTYMANASGPISGTIAGSVKDINDAHGDILASFSSRGPNSASLLPDILKPQVAAPGRAIWAAYAQGSGGDGDYTYNVIQGTSMASPHVAGAGALLMALHPEWTPSMIESAMATTANTNVFNDDGINQATPFGIGSGRIDLGAAAQAGLVLDVTPAEFQAANPGAGGDPKELNLSSMANSNCLSTCSWTRIVSSTYSSSVTWTSATNVPTGMLLTVEPIMFDLPAYGTQMITVTADVSALPVGQWTFGEVTLTPSITEVSDVHFPVAVIQGGEPPAIEVPTEIETTQVMSVTAIQPFTITNSGGTDLNWVIFEDADLLTRNGGWSDDFDSYATGAQLHGLGGWFGWGNDVAFGALTSDVQARSVLNSADINGNSDLVHPYTQTSGIWTYTAWQYIPGSFSGTSYFIMLNQYDHACTPCNWSVQVNFNSATGLMTDDGGANSMPYVTDAWAKIEVVVDLDADTQTFFYNGNILYSGVWNGYISGAGGGSDVIAAVDLFANGASTIYYDDLSLAPGAPTVGTCQLPSDIAWLDVSPTSGTIVSGTSEIVDLSFDSTGLAAGVYAGTLCVTSDDPVSPLVSTPVTLTVLAQAPPDIMVDPTGLSANQAADNVTVQTFDISNVGEADLVWTIDEDTETGASRAAASTVFLDQSPNQSNGSFSDVDCNACGAGTQVIADNFVLANSAVITQITFWSGYFPNNTPLAQDDLTVIFHADSGGSGPGAAFSTETTVPYTRTTTGIVLFGVSEYKHTITLSNPVALDAGTYWVEIYNDTTGNADSFFWEVGDLDVVNGIANGAFSTSAPGSSWNTTASDFAILIEGFETGICVDLADIPWVAVTPTAGTTVSSTSSTIDVTFDSTGLANGVYTGTLCINSNDPDMPLVQVPLTLTVEPLSYSVLVAPDSAITDTAGTVVTYTLHVTNTGNTADTFDLSVAGNAWTTTLSDSSVSLGIGESTMVTVMVDISSGATDGEMDVATVTATSQGDSAVSDSAMLTTTAVVDETFIYLPFVAKN